MVTVSFDPEARTLYWYFTEIEAGSTALEGECDGTLLLDSNGQVIGLELELDESVRPADLALALEHPLVSYQPETFTLTVLLLDEEPTGVQPLHESVVLDFDGDERLQGCETATSEEFELGERLGRLGALLVSLDDDEPAAAGEGPVVFQVPPEAGEDVDEDTPDGEGPAPAAAGASPAEAAGLPPLVMPPPTVRSGFAAIVGRPNVGKSTLLNALLGQKVAIVSRKPQTTRTAIRGIINRPGAQVVFVDTPGIHTPRNRLGNFMVEQARRAIPDADVVCMVVDISEPPGRLDHQIAQIVRKIRRPRILVLNKIDKPSERGQEHLRAYRELAPWDMEVAVSALRGEGLETLVDEIIRRLPQGTTLYPEDQVTDQSERELAAELVREQVLRNTEEEVPHGVAVEVEEWEEKERALYIRMTIYVEKDSQKGILIGAGGAMLKKIGSNARANIQKSFGRPVFLDLWIKTRANWRDDPGSLRWLGYQES